MIVESECTDAPVVVSGKFLRTGKSKWYAKGLTYGPFAPNEHEEALPPPEQVRCDFAQMVKLGANSLRLYFPPPVWLLDCALEFGLRVLIDVPWEKHRCFFEDWDAMQAARDQVRQVARHQGNHPAVFAISVVNEFPNDIVRFYGRQRLEQFVDELLEIVHQESPACLATFANFPTTEFLQPRNVDFHCFNVYLHDPEVLGVYLDRLQHLADSKPLLLGEYGIDSLREGEEHQAQLLKDHVDAVFSHGLAGSFVFAFTDDWFTGGHQIEDWMFGVTRVDRSPKPATTAIQQAWKNVPARLLLPEVAPTVSVVVCSYNGARTLEGCLDSLMRLNYPEYEVILVDDGSQDATPEIALQFPLVRTIRQDNQGLSVERNVASIAHPIPTPAAPPSIGFSTPSLDAKPGSRSKNAMSSSKVKPACRWLRGFAPGTVHAGCGAVDMLKQIVDRLRQHWPDVTILVRGDSGVGEPEMYDYGESEGFQYAFGYATNETLKRRVAELELEENAKQLWWMTGRSGFQLFHTFDDYQAGSWPHARRIITKVEFTKQGSMNPTANVRFVVTNMNGFAKDIYHGYYTQRGNVPERPIGELKNGLYMDRLSSPRFLANSHKLMVHMLAYLLYVLFREASREAAKQDPNDATSDEKARLKELSTMEVGTARVRLFKVGALVKATHRRIWFHVASHWPGRELLTTAIRVVTAHTRALQTCWREQHLFVSDEELLRRRCLSRAPAKIVFAPLPLK